MGFVTSSLIYVEVWQLIAWGLISSGGLLLLARQMIRIEAEAVAKIAHNITRASLIRFVVGLLVGLVAFGVHVGVIAAFAGPIRFESVAGVGAVTALIYFVRFVATSCMEEIGFRGYPLRRLMAKLGIWPAICITSVAFGLSHLPYGWGMPTIVLGVIPFGIAWGMSAIATEGIAVPIGLHAAWNFANWCVGGRKETGLLRAILEDDAPTQLVGTTSYLSICAALTIAFWLLHRRKQQRKMAHNG